MVPTQNHGKVPRLSDVNQHPTRRAEGINQKAVYRETTLSKRSVIEDSHGEEEAQA